MKILCWNILNPYSFDGKWIGNNGSRISLLRDEILSISPDIICLQEVYYDFLVSLSADYKIVSQSWKDTVGRFGCAILHKKSNRNTTVALIKAKRQKTKEGKGIPYNRVVVYNNAINFEIINLHLTMEYPKVYPSFERIIKTNYNKKKQTYPIFICGDFNCGPSAKPSDYNEIINLSNTLGHTFIPTLTPTTLDHFLLISNKSGNPSENWEGLFDKHNMVIKIMPNTKLIEGLPEACSKKQKITTNGLSDHSWILFSFIIKQEKEIEIKN